MTEVLGSVRVLHVDDDPDFADLTAASLEREDDRFTVETATTAREGLQRLAERDVDCVVSDYRMPGMDGVEFLTAVREDHPDLPFVLFTGEGSEEVASEAIARGATDYLQKGTGTEQYELLANRVANAVEQYRATRRAASLDRVRRVLGDVHRVLIRAETREAVERRVCAALSDADPYRFAWIGEYDPGTETVEPRTAAGTERGYLEAVEITTDETPTGRGPTGRAVRTREIAVVQDVADDPAYEPWREDALDRAYRSSAAIPLVSGDTLYGVLNVYADRTGAFDERERDLLCRLGEDVAHAVARVDGDARATDGDARATDGDARATDGDAQGAADARGTRYERVVENLPVGVYRATPGEEGEIVDANPALADIFGANSADAMLGRRVSDFYRDSDERAAFSRRLRREGIVREAELRQETLDGDRIWISVTAMRTEVDGEVYFDGIVRDITDRKERERRLERFRSAVEHAGHVVLITGTDGTIEYVNDSFEPTTGYTPEEALGQSPAILQSGEHDHAFYRDLWETILAGEVWQGEVINERKDGERYVIDQTIAPITGQHGDDGRDGEITGFVAVNRDITERKERERDLTVLRRAIDQAGIGIGTYDADGDAVYVNDRLADLFGTDPDDLRDRNVADLGIDVPRDDRDAFDDETRRIRETRVERADDDVPVEVVVSGTTVDEELHLVTTVRDVTAHRERERTLERFRSAVEHAGHSVVITDTDGTIEYVNDAFEETTGYAASEAIGRTPAMLKSGEHDEAFYRDLWETVLAGEVWQDEVVNERADGERYVVDQTIAPITDERGGNGEEMTGFVAINRDVTDLKEYERELEQQNERLGQYGHTVAHDLRNPLNLLRGKLEGFRSETDGADAVDPATVRERCTDAIEVVERMERLVDDLLAMAEQGKLVLDPVETSLAPVAEDAWEQVETERAALSVGDGTVEVDPDRLRELLTNLFRNAVEHAGDDVAVRVGPLDFADGFFVADDGPGIPADERDSVFERGVTTDPDGTGFGLAIVERIAHAHGWTVSVTESRDGGARFEFRADGPA